jgi:hypothetical protein
MIDFIACHFKASLKLLQVDPLPQHGLEPAWTQSPGNFRVADTLRAPRAGR